MLSNQSLQSWVDHLRAIFPITAIVHVGVGSGHILTHYAEWGVSCALLIEAEETLFQQLASATQMQEGLIAHKALISDKECSKTFFLASNPNEHGVIKPENFTDLWRNLKTQEERQIDSKTLESVLNSQNTLAAPVNWCVIDCLPALQVLQGTGKFIEGLEVIITRAILKEERCSEIGASKNELDIFLASQGFYCIALEEERQPALGSLVYIRNWKNKYRVTNVQLEALTGEKRTLQESQDHHAKLASERQVQLEQLILSRDEETTKYQGLQQQLEAIGKLKDEAVKESEELRVQLEALTGEKGSLLESRDHHAKRASEWQVQLEQLTLLRDEETTKSQGLQKQLEAIGKLKDEAVKESEELRVQLEALTGEKRTLQESRDHHGKLASERQLQLEQLTLLRDEETKKSQGQQQQLEAIGKLKDEAEKESKELKIQLEALTGEKRTLQESRDHHGKLASERQVEISALKINVQKASDRISSLELQIAEQKQSLQLINDEMLKAEAQIELITNVLLREDGI